MNKCRTCKWWLADQVSDAPDREGYCNRYPPVLNQAAITVSADECARETEEPSDVVIIDTHSSLYWSTPKTDEADGCGEWMENEVKE